MRREPEVAIVGAGVTGLATARALAAAGRSVTVLERFQVGHTRGSSHGTSRIFRVVYDNAHYVRLAQTALQLWRDAERETGRTLLTTTGSLDLGDDLRRFTRSLEATETPYELLPGREARRRYPQLRPPADACCLLQEDGGFLRADAALEAFRDAARRRGALVLEGARVDRLEEANGHVVLYGEGFEVRAASVVVTAGAWSNRLLEPLGLGQRLRPTRETVVYVRFEPTGPLPTVIDRAAELDAELPGPAGVAYALPAPGVGLKAGIHQAGRAADPDEVTGPDDAIARAALAWIGSRFEGGQPHLLRAETCLYTNTEDESFVLERRGRIVVGSACSGHGFKFAPEIGRQLAELALELLA